MPQDRVRKFTEENKELAAQLHAQMKALQQKPAASSSKTKKVARANGSDFSSARGSEERVASGAAHGRRRNRDYDLEHVSRCAFFHFLPGISDMRVIGAAPIEP